MAPRGSTSALCAATAVAALLSAACLGPPPPSDDGPGARISVVVTLYPYQWLAQGIGGDAVVVTNIVGTTTPHDYEPTAADIIALSKADLMVSNGLELEAWFAGAMANAPASVVRFEAAASAQPLVAAGARTQEIGPGGGGHDPNGGSGTGAMDPHLWLDPVRLSWVAANLTLTIRDLVLPAQKADVEARGAAVVEGLMVRHRAYAMGLGPSCGLRTVLTSHEATSYLADRYDLSVLSILSFNLEGGEPSPQHLAALSEEAKEHGIDVILVEPQLSAEVAKTLADEIDGRTLPFETIETLSVSKARAGQDLGTLMDANLVSLRAALHCP